MPNRRQAAVALASGAAAGLGGCGTWWRPTTVTMDLLFDDRACAGTQAPVLLVLLPGANMMPAEMVAQGMVAAVRQRQLAADVVVAGATLQYVYDGSMLQRLRADVIEPFRARGYRRIWLAGISLGGFVALGYAMKHAGEIEGITLLAPYLGRRALVQEIGTAGGPRPWHAAQVPAADDMDAQVWRWLAAPPPGAPPLHLGYGREDRFADGHGMLASLLPASHVATAAGGHDWPPWRTLWAQWLDRGLLPAACERSDPAAQPA